MATMIEVGLTLLAILPQTEDRIDFSLEPGTILAAVAFLVLINVLLAAALYPFFKDGSLFGEESTSAKERSGTDRRDMVEEAPSDDGEPLEEKVDQFLEDIHGERSR